jgi:hypothetical protein
MSRQNDEALIRKYLLGDLDERQLEQVEEQLLCDDDFAERLYAAQDDLIDDYAFNLLPDDERERFEKSFTLTDERRKKLLFAQALESYVKLNDVQQPEDARPLFQRWKNLLLYLKGHRPWLALALASVVLLIVLTPQMVRWYKPSNQVSLEQNRASIERQIAELNQLPVDANIQALPTLELTLQPTLLREGGEVKRAVLTPDIKNLSLRLVLPQVRYGSYRALVRTVEGRELFAVENLKSQGSAAEIPLKIPSEFFPNGDYQIELQGIAGDGHAEDAARYNFQIRR